MPGVSGHEEGVCRETGTCGKFSSGLRGALQYAETGWLGGLDSNQDIQIQSLVSYRLNDLPTPRKGGKKPQTTNLKTVNGEAEIVNRSRPAKTGIWGR